MASGLEPIERASRDEISALQLERMQWSLKHAYDNVPHYRAKFDAHGVRPEDLKSLSDLSKFPFTTKQDLRDNYPYGLFAVPMRDIARIHASSGTTGKQTVVGYTKNDLDMWANVMARSLRAAGAGPDDIVHVAHAYGLFTGGFGVHYGAERLGCAVIPMGGGQTAKQVQLIRDFRPTMIIATPSYALNIADEFVRQGMDPAACSLRIGCFGAEPWGEGMRAEIQDRLGIDAMDLYGLSEVVGPGVGCECIESKDGPTIWEDHFYPEIIDPETGEVQPDGQPGELVFTSLSKEALPIVRYRTRDLSRLLPPTSRAFRRIAKITGRSDDMLIIRGVNLFPGHIEELIMKDSKLSGHYLLEVYREGPLDQMEVMVEVKPEFAHASAEMKHDAERTLQHAIKSWLGVTTRVRILDPGHLPRPEGKAKRVIDKRTL
ncbi:MAG TPA: phenylacetate--CoA ligase PaaK [Rhodocyclaceae bacterium]|nr:phenylacetate--CoA ligase PaaK [Rhodocyclaceae bacterium]